MLPQRIQNGLARPTHQVVMIKQFVTLAGNGDDGGVYRDWIENPLLIASDEHQHGPVLANLGLLAPVLPLVLVQTGDSLWDGERDHPLLQPSFSTNTQINTIGAQNRYQRPMIRMATGIKSHSRQAP